MSRTFIYPYNSASASVNNLKQAMGLLKIKREGSRFVGTPDKIVINWGNKMVPSNVEDATIINRPEAVALASNKLNFFRHVSGSVSIPEFSVDYNEAKSWLDEGSKVVVRELLEGSGGRGITLIENVVDWDNYNHSNSRMYVRYIPKKDEYRIHIMNGNVIDAQRKARNRNYHDNDVDWQIRNHDRGFVFVREGVEPPEALIQECKEAVAMCGLDFGAVDVIWNCRRQKAYVLEVNTAPGIEATTVDNYSSALESLVQEVRENPYSYEELRRPRFGRALDTIFPVQPPMSFVDDITTDVENF